MKTLRKRFFAGPPSRAGIAVAGLAAAAIGIAAWTAVSASAPASRRLLIEQTVRLRDQADGPARVWVPLPPNTPEQTVTGIAIEADRPGTMTADPVFGNRFVVFDFPSKEAGEIRLSYQVERREQIEFGRGAPTLTAAERARYLRSGGLIVIDDEVRRRARGAVAGRDGVMEKARAVYDHVFETMAYDKSGSGWGRGDVLYACEVGKGNCTDFHSLFIALLRAEGVPARFRIGYPVARTSQGTLRGYHCWAEFYVDAKGWFPVDISEAWKNPEKKEYFFGRLDADRFVVGTGRDVTLVPPQNGDPLNWVLDPVAQSRGRRLALSVSYQFENVKEGVVE